MTSVASPSSVLNIDNLALHFLGQDSVVEALKGISLHIDKGEVVGVVQAPAGCGESCGLPKPANQKCAVPACKAGRSRQKLSKCRL